MINTALTVTQVTLLLICLRITLMFFTIATTTPPGNQDIWIALLLSILYAVLLFSPLLYLNRKFPQKSMADFAKASVGTFLSKIVLLLYVVFLFFLSVINTVNLTLFIGSSLIPETPQYMLLLFIVIPSAYAAYKGIGIILQTGQIIFPIVLTIVCLTILLGIQLYDYKALLPVLKDSSLAQINSGGFSFAVCFHDAIFLFFLAPYMEKKAITKTFIISLLISTSLFILISLAPFMALGIEQAKHANYPFYSFLRHIRVGDFIERIEAFVLGVWIMVELFKLSVYTFLASDCLREAMGSKAYQKYIIPFSLLLFWVSRSPAIYSFEIINKLLSFAVFPLINTFFIFVIPLLLALVYSLRNIFSDK